MSIIWDISRRNDVEGLPLQFYVSYKRHGTEGRTLSTLLLQEPYDSVPAWLDTMREVLDAIEAAYDRDGLEGVA